MTVQIQGNAGCHHDLCLGPVILQLQGLTFRGSCNGICQGGIGSAGGCIQDHAGAAAGAGAVFIVVTQRRDLFLGSQNFTADTAFDAVSQTSLSTGSSLAGNGFLSMTQGRNLLLGIQDLFADGTHGTVSQTGFGAGGRITGNNFLAVSQSDSLTVDVTVTAERAGMGGKAARSAGGGRHNRFIIMGADRLRIGIIIGGCQGQVAHGPELQRVRIIDKVDIRITGIGGDRITLCHGTDGSTGHEQHTETRIAVGHVHQIVGTIHGDEVPHMAAALAVKVHVTRDADAVQTAQIAQILKCLGIALADHHGTLIPVKDIDQLPGITVAAGISAIDDRIVIFDPIADFISVSCQLVVGRFGCIGIHDGLGIDLGGTDLGHIGGHCGVAAILIAGGNIKDSVKLGNGCLRPVSRSVHALTGTAHGIVHAGARSLVKPVQVKGAVTEQGTDDLLLIVLGFKQRLYCRRILDALDAQLFSGPFGLQTNHIGHISQNECRRAAVCGHILNFSLQCIIDSLLGSIQILPGSGAEGGPLGIVQLLLDIHGEQLIIVRQIRIIHDDFGVHRLVFNQIIRGHGKYRRRNVLEHHAYNQQDTQQLIDRSFHYTSSFMGITGYILLFSTILLPKRQEVNVFNVFIFRIYTKTPQPKLRGIHYK